MINARSETAPEKPYFRRAFRERRCLIPADRFYEWKRENGAKQTLLFSHARRQALCLHRPLGGWNKDEGIRFCTIPTTQADDLVGGIH